MSLPLGLLKNNCKQSSPNNRSSPYSITGLPLTRLTCPSHCRYSRSGTWSRMFSNKTCTDHPVRLRLPLKVGASSTSAAYVTVRSSSQRLPDAQLGCRPCQRRSGLVQIILTRYPLDTAQAANDPSKAHRNNQARSHKIVGHLERAYAASSKLPETLALQHKHVCDHAPHATSRALTDNRLRSILVSPPH